LFYFFFGDAIPHIKLNIVCASVVLVANSAVVLGAMVLFSLVLTNGLQPTENQLIKNQFFG
jgi:hypothetical protein